MSTQRGTRLVTARIGKGKAVHHYYPKAGRTSCATGGMGDADATIVEGGTITCKKCLRSLELEVGYAHEAALAENLERTLKAEAAAPVVEVADLHVRKIVGGSGVFRVLGTEELDRGVAGTVLVVWLENVLTRVRHHVRPDTLESHYVAVDQTGRPQSRVERVELHLEHNITRERHVFEGLEGEPGEGVRTLAWLRHRDSGKLYSMAAWVLWADYTPVCEHGVRCHELCEGCGEVDANGHQVDPNADAYDAHMLATQDGELKAPRVHPSVPNTVEAWKAYAERVEASRDAAEAKVADLLVEVAELRSKLAGQTPAPAEFRVGDRVLVRQYGEELEARVTFVGVGGQTIHAKVIGGELEVVRARGEVRHV